ncbi:Conserved domain protein [uncultured Candidatus Thioglobus sp.]|nr:Conserved domain protein [uncultured Candidatus Thioglobus sp.]
MKTTKALQQMFYQDVLCSDAVQGYLGNDNFSGGDLIKIYHNQYFFSLKQALGNSYSCVKRLVGENFFNSLTSDFVKTHPSKTGNIINYGNEFADFIADDTRCQTVPYLADMAKFERLYERCYFSLNAEFFMASSYPLVKIWQLNEDSKTLDLSSGGDYLRIYKQGAEVIVERITEQQYEGENEQTN